MELPYQQYFDALPCYVTVQNRDLKVMTANARFVRDFGNYQGRHCYQVYKQQPEKCEICPVERSFRDGQSHRSEETILCPDGREVSVIVYTDSEFETILCIGNHDQSRKGSLSLNSRLPIP